MTHLTTPLPRARICLDSGSGVDAPLTAFLCLIPDLWHAQCPLAKRSNPKDWQVFLVMDLLTSVDPLMGGVFHNSYEVSHQALLSKVFNINHICVCCVSVCVFGLFVEPAKVLEQVRN